MGDFDDLLAEVALARKLKKEQKENEEEKVSFGGRVKTPNALVLVTITSYCNCGKVYTSPNRKLMLRFERNYSAPKKWYESYNYIKREVTQVRQKVSACEGCFSTTFISFVDHSAEGEKEENGKGS